MEKYYKKIRDWNDYLYSNGVLKNKANIKNVYTLDLFEYEKTSKLIYNIISRNIEINSFKDYCNLHYNIFKDVYDWAGDIRTVDMGKGGSYFLHWKNIINKGEKIFEDLKNNNYFIGYSDNDFYLNMIIVHFTLNDIHPFREGNGRTEKTFMQLLALKNNRILDFSKIDNNLINSIDRSYEVNNGDNI